MAKRSRISPSETMGIARGETIGIDLGDRFSDVCVLDEDGQVVKHERIATTAGDLKALSKRRRGARVVMEVGTHSPWISRIFEGLGHEVVVGNAAVVRRVAGTKDKSDQIDAERLARLGRVDPRILEPIRHRGEEVQRDRALLRVRDGLVRARSALVTQARGIAKSLGERLPRCDAQNFAKRMDREELRDLFPGLGTLLGVVRELSERIAALDGAIEEVSRKISCDGATAADHGSRADHGIGVRGDDRGSAALQEQPKRGGVSGAEAEEVPVRGSGSGAADHQGRRRVSAANVGAGSAVHPWTSGT